MKALLFVLFAIFSVSFADSAPPQDTTSCSTETTTTSTCTDSPTASPTALPDSTLQTELAATRTISLEEASAIAKQQADNPNSFPNDPETKDVLYKLNGWITGMVGSGDNSISHPGNSDGDSGTNDGGNQDCARTFVPILGMTCDSAEDSLGLERGTLMALNPEINDKCTNMIAGTTYCIECT